MISKSIFQTFRSRQLLFSNVQASLNGSRWFRSLGVSRSGWGRLDFRARDLSGSVAASIDDSSAEDEYQVNGTIRNVAIVAHVDHGKVCSSDFVLIGFDSWVLTFHCLADNSG